MNTTTIRQQLHQYIDIADDKKVEAIFTILENEMVHSNSYSAEDLKKFYDRRDKYISGETTTFTAEESHEYIRQQGKKK